MASEKVHYFSYISYGGGCLSSSARDEFWISLTNKRVLYKANVTEEDKRTIEKNGILPLEKVSFIEVTDMTENEGCSSTQAYQLRISTSGGTIVIPIPTKEKGYEIRKIFSEIVEEYHINK